MKRHGVTGAFRLLAGVLWLTAALPGRPEAGVVHHTVAAGQSLAAISREFYGDNDRYRLLALYNGIANPANLKAGAKLKLPYSDLITLRRGQTMGNLAGKYLGDTELYSVIAVLNGIRDPGKVPAGTHLRIPVLIPYYMHRGQSLAGVAREYYGDTAYFRLIATASGIKDPTRIKAGARLLLPFILNRAARPAAPRHVKKPPARTTRKVPSAPKVVKATSKKEYLDRLARAEQEFRRGRFEEARRRADTALEGLKGSDRARGLRLMANLSLAYGKPEHARDQLTEAYRLDPGFEPDPGLYNPDMIELFREARKAAAAKSRTR